MVQSGSIFLVCMYLGNEIGVLGILGKVLVYSQVKDSFGYMRYDFKK